MPKEANCGIHAVIIIILIMHNSDMYIDNNYYKRDQIGVITEVYSFISLSPLCMVLKPFSLRQMGYNHNHNP